MDYCTRYHHLFTLYYVLYYCIVYIHVFRVATRPLYFYQRGCRSICNPPSPFGRGGEGLHLVGLVPIFWWTTWCDVPGIGDSTATYISSNYQLKPRKKRFWWENIKNSKKHQKISIGLFFVIWQTDSHLQNSKNIIFC